MTELLAGKTAVVTGGSSGIGRSIGLEFAREGADVLIVDRREQPRDSDVPTARRIEQETPRRAKFVRCDVSRPADLRQAVEQSRELGEIDVMVNNAGVFRVEEFLDVTEQEYDELMDVNAKGVFFGAQAAARLMAHHGNGGSIINMSSRAGIRGVGAAPTYSSSKGAVRLLTYSLADALGPHGIRVNAVHPGLIETSMTTRDVEYVGTPRGEAYVEGIPLGRHGQPVDPAKVCVFLASDYAGYVSGASIPVAGGKTNT